jgi:phosphonopyruvate decarboxylase
MRIGDMMKVTHLLHKMDDIGVSFFTGVPDSQLKALCDTLYSKYTLGKDHIVAANEGAAVGLAAGHYLATGKPALVYMQNSGIGKIVNPVASLLNEKVYCIPAVFVVGWRGEPGIHDEPQHVFQGEITVEMMDVLNIKSYILSKETTDQEFDSFIEDGKIQLEQGKSIAFIVRKGALSSDIKADYDNDYQMTREEALNLIVQNAGQDDVFVSTTGKASRELFEIREALQQGHEKDFLTVGSMGHASMIAMGIALEKGQRNIWCIDGDGAAIMHMGSLAIESGTKCDNLIHVILNNGAHETVGGMPVAYGQTDFTKVAKALGFDNYNRVDCPQDLVKCVQEIKKHRGTKLIEVMVALGSRENLGRPTTTPIQNKEALMHYLSI